MTMSVTRWDNETKRKISDSVKQYFANMSQEERQAINNKMSETRQRKEQVYRFFESNKEYFKRIAEWKRAKNYDS